MVGNLLVRGMVIGVLAAILTFGFLRMAGEPAVDKAIAFETQLDAAKAAARTHEAEMKGEPRPVEATEAELVSRPVQAGIGLFTGVAVYNVAFGGLFALVFSLAYGRMGRFGPRATALLLALSGIVAVYIVPTLKYPANPPSVGEAETIRMRTALYFVMIALSLAAMAGDWNAALVAAGAYLVIVAAAAAVLPGVNEVPEGFPADVLWQFRIASLGAQVIMWTTIGLGFGAAAERVVGWTARTRFRAA